MILWHCVFSLQFQNGGTELQTSLTHIITVINICTDNVTTHKHNYASPLADQHQDQEHINIEHLN